MYKNATDWIISAIQSNYSTIEPKECDLISGEKAPLSHLLWMSKRISDMSQSIPEEREKAARWIGWLFAHAELHNLLDNKKTRELIAKDTKKHYEPQ